MVDDGYRDEVVERFDAHRPAGPLRGSKYSALEAGTAKTRKPQSSERLIAAQSP